MPRTQAQAVANLLEEQIAHTQYAAEELVELERRASKDDTRAIIHKLQQRLQIIEEIARMMRQGKG